VANYVKRSNELEKADPVISYFCKYGELLLLVWDCEY
jgi:hypothetical protein